jgi:ABC-type multidrug transport system ATPase subunit
MKQKLELSCALIHRPVVLFLDEPTTGVDAVSRRELWEMLKKLREFGITILVSTPYMDEAGLCDRVALIHHGRVLTIDRPEAIVQQYRRPLLAVRSSRMYQLIQDLRQFEFTHSAFLFGDHVHLALKAPVWPEAVHSFLAAKGHTEIGIHPAVVTIEDCFMDLSG